MARRKRVKKEYLSSANAQQVANRGMNAAFSQSSGVLRKNAETGKWEDSGGYTRSTRGRMSTDGRTAGGSTWTFTKKNADGTTARQSGRSQIASRRQRYYDVRTGLGLAGG